MLKAWKQAWKKEAERRSQTPPTSETTAGASTASGLTSLKRPLADGDDRQTLAVHRKNKRVKVEKNDDRSYSMLPDTLNEDVTMDEGDSNQVPDPNLSEGFNEALLKQAKKKNTLVFVNSEKQRNMILKKVIRTFCSDKMVAGKDNSGVILVAGDKSTADKRLVTLSHLGAALIPRGSGNYQKSSFFTQDKKVAVFIADDLATDLHAGDWEMDDTPIIIDEFLTGSDNEALAVVNNIGQAYWSLEQHERPRLFGFTRRTRGVGGFDRALLRIEEFLDATFFGVDEWLRGALRARSERAKEVVLFYDPHPNTGDTTLMRGIRNLDPRMEVFRATFRGSKYALGDLGTCAGELVWRRVLKEMEEEDPVFEEDDDIDSKVSSRLIKHNVAKYIRNWMFAMPNLNPSARGFNVTPKFLKLVEALKAGESHGQYFRGIVFVQKRCIALVLEELLGNLDGKLKFLRPRALVGHDTSSSSQSVSEILDQFQAGICNLLIATKYAEDLDICKVNMVIRYDLFDSYVSYAYCCARARGSDCHLIHLAERGNDVHRHILNKTARRSNKLDVWIDDVGKSPAGAIPRFPLQETIDPYRSDSDDENDDSVPFIQDPTTSGKIFVRDAMTVVYRVVSQLAYDCDDKELRSKQLFEFETLRDGSSFMYSCTVILPPNSPLQRLSGPPCYSKAQARREACYQVCCEFYNRGILDYRLFPRPRLPSSRSQRTAFISTRLVENPDDEEDDIPLLPPSKPSDDNREPGVHLYGRKRPDFWKHTQPVLRSCLYPTVVSFSKETHKSGSGYHAPMLILTRLPLPTLPNVDLHFSEGTGKAAFHRAQAVEVDDEMLQDIYKYTVRLIRKITNKPFVCALEKMLYFLAPLGKKFDEDAVLSDSESQLRYTFPDVADHIPWDDVKLAGSETCIALRTQDLQTLINDTDDALIQDRWSEFGRRYYAVRMRPDLSPLSKPADSLREQAHENLLEFVRARRKQPTILQNERQPLIEVGVCPSLTNNLTPVEKPNDGKFFPAKYLIPELCSKSPFPGSVHRTALLLPSILFKLDTFLLTKELNAKFFDHAVREDELLASISTPAAGSGIDYERLELLGDAYLKYLSSIYLFVTFPAMTEGSLHLARQRIISNQSLLRNASRCDIPQYIQARTLGVRQWAPPNFVVYRPPKAQAQDEAPDTTEISLEAGELDQKSKEADDNNNVTQYLGDKAIADVAEAIIGAAYLTGGREIALKVTKALNIPVPLITKWSDFGRKALAPPPEATAKLRPGSIERVEEIIGHRFDHQHILAQALTHSSVLGREMTSYERLEFIGDAILDFHASSEPDFLVVIRHIFDRDRKLSPGALTQLKAAMVSNAVLAAICVYSGLHEHLLYASSDLDENVQDYIDLISERQREAHEVAARDDTVPAQYWIDVEPPKALSDLIESIIGAVYVSDNFSPVGAEAFYNNVLRPFYDQHLTLEVIVQHPTKILFEMLQARGCQEFSLIKEETNPNVTEFGHTVCCKIVIHDILIVSTTDFSMTACARRVSDMALDAIAGDANFLAETCKCKERHAAKKAMKKAGKHANAAKSGVASTS